MEGHQVCASETSGSQSVSCVCWWPRWQRTYNGRSERPYSSPCLCHRGHQLPLLMSVRCFPAALELRRLLLFCHLHRTMKSVDCTTEGPLRSLFELTFKLACYMPGIVQISLQIKMHHAPILSCLHALDSFNPHKVCEKLLAPIYRWIN